MPSFTITLDSTNEAEIKMYADCAMLNTSCEEFRAYLRNQLKHGEFTPEQQQLLEVIWEAYHDIIGPYTHLA